MDTLALSTRSVAKTNVARGSALWCTALALLLILHGCSTPIVTQPDPINPKDTTTVPVETFFSAPTEMGTPYDTDGSDDIIIRRFQYALSYNPRLNVANWVAWNEDSAWYGPAERCDCFQPDPALSAECAMVTNSVYSSSGYDRGHIMNSEARTRCDSDNAVTFFYSNIFPQTATLNRNTWYSLEKYCDSLSKKANKELYVVAGGVYHSGKRLKDLVTIPDSCWKVIVVLDRSQRRSAVTANTRVIAVMMANIDYTKENNDWRLYTTTVKEIERASGYNILSALPQSIQDIIENKRDHQ